MSVCPGLNQTWCRQKPYITLNLGSLVLVNDFSLPINIFEILENYETSHITVREIVFQEAERQFFGSINIFPSAAVWALLSRFSGGGGSVKKTPIMGLTDIIEF